MLPVIWYNSRKGNSWVLGKGRRLLQLGMCGGPPPMASVKSLTLEISVSGEGVESRKDDTDFRRERTQEEEMQGRPRAGGSRALKERPAPLAVRAFPTSSRGSPAGAEWAPSWI